MAKPTSKQSPARSGTHAAGAARPERRAPAQAARRVPGREGAHQPRPAARRADGAEAEERAPRQDPGAARPRQRVGAARRAGRDAAGREHRSLQGRARSRRRGAAARRSSRAASACCRSPTIRTRGCSPWRCRTPSTWSPWTRSPRCSAATSRSARCSPARRRSRAPSRTSTTSEFSLAAILQEIDAPEDAGALPANVVRRGHPAAGAARGRAAGGCGEAPRLGHPPGAGGRLHPRALPRRRRAAPGLDGAQEVLGRHRRAAEGHVRHGHHRDARAAGRTHLAQHRRAQRGFPRRRPADDPRREPRAAHPRPALRHRAAR